MPTISPLPRAYTKLEWIVRVEVSISDVLTACEEAGSAIWWSEHALTGCARSRGVLQWPSELPVLEDDPTAEECVAYARKVADMITLLRECLTEHLTMAAVLAKENPEDSDTEVMLHFCRKMRAVRRSLNEEDFALTLKLLMGIQESADFDY